ncbi:MAG: hypothetical protein V4606_00045, partial [Patescibacteria group bacterium]
GRLIDSTNYTFDGSRLSVLNLAISGTSTFTGTSTFATTTMASTTITTLNLINGLADASISDILTITAGVINNTPIGATTPSTGVFTNATTTNATTTQLAISTLTSGRVPYVTTGGRLLDSVNFTFDGTNLGLGNTQGIAWSGSRALYASTTRNNYFFGSGAGSSVTTGNNIIAIGSNAFLNATSTSDVIAIGRDAGIANTSGSGNVFIGPAFAGYNNTTGGDNVFIGYATGGNSRTGSANTFVGNNAGNGLVSGDSNTFFGVNTAVSLATSSQSTIIGAGAGWGIGGNYQASNLTILGREAGYNLQTGADNNILIGHNAANSMTTGANNLIIGYNIEAPSNTASNQLNIGNLIFGTGIDGEDTTISSGNIGIGSTSPSAKLTVAGSFLATGTSTLATTTVTDFTIARALRDTTNSAGTTGMVLQTTGTSTRWVATSTLGLTGGGSSLFTDGGATTYLTSLTDNLGIGTTTASERLTVAGNALIGGNITATGTLTIAGTSTLATTSIAGLLQMGTTSVASRFNLDVAGFSTAGTAGLNRFYTSTNAASGTVQFGELGYVRIGATATTTMVGSMFRVEDSTTFGNTIRGFEVQTNRGTNTRGENTALSGFARTFGVRGYTSADAGGVFEPAGGYFETGGTTQGNAIRGYSSTITSAGLMSLFQDTSAFTGNGLIMNLGNGTGSFTGKFMDLQVAGATKFNVASTGTLFTLGDISITATNTDPADNNVVGIYLGASGFASINRAANPAMSLGRTTDGAVLEFYSAGTVQGSVSIAGATVSYNAFTGSHFGLTGSTTYSMGTVLALTGENQSYNDIAASEILYGMTESSEENSPLVIGSYLSVLEPTLAESAANPTLVMAVGNGAMWVADQGENITRGDYLISSNVAGHAERDPQTAEVSNIIARASEDIDWSTVTTEINGVKHKRITVFFETFTRSNINLALIASSTVELASIDEDSVTGNFMTGLFSKLTEWFGNAHNGIGSMYANVFNANERICVDGECLTADDIRDLKDAIGAPQSPAPSTGGSGGSSEGEGSGETGNEEPPAETPPPTPVEEESGGTSEPPAETLPEPEPETEPIVEEPPAESPEPEPETPEEITPPTE